MVEQSGLAEGGSLVVWLVIMDDLYMRATILDSRISFISIFDIDLGGP